MAAGGPKLYEAQTALGGSARCRVRPDPGDRSHVSRGHPYSSLVLDHHSYPAGRGEIAGLIDDRELQPVHAVGKTSGVEFLEHSVDDRSSVHVADHMPGGRLFPLTIFHLIKLETLVVGCAPDGNPP